MELATCPCGAGFPNPASRGQIQCANGHTFQAHLDGTLTQNEGFTVEQMHDLEQSATRIWAAMNAGAAWVLRSVERET